MRLRPSLSANLLLCLCFLWAQCAVAHHDLEHHSHEENELCEIFLSTDLNSVSYDVEVEIIHPITELKLLSFKPQSVAERVFEPTPARSPPVHS